MTKQDIKVKEIKGWTVVTLSNKFIERLYESIKKND